MLYERLVAEARRDDGLDDARFLRGDERAATVALMLAADFTGTVWDDHPELRRGSGGKMFLPAGDGRSSLILSKAFLLVDDTKITGKSPFHQIKRGA